MRKYLKVEKKPWFSKSVYYNDKHKKMDWIVRGIMIAAMLVILFIVGITPDLVPVAWRTIFPLVPIFLLLIPEVLRIVVKALLEWKYSENRNDHIITISQLDVITLFLHLLVSILFILSVFFYV